MTDSLWRKRQEPEQPAPKWQGARFDSALHDQPPQPEQEPVGYLSEGGAERLLTKKQAHEHIKNFRLFTHDVPLYDAPPQRKPLTDGEIWDLHIKMSAALNCKLSDLIELTRAVEAAHGIKENT